MSALSASPAAVRAFAVENGFEVGGRGRLSDEVVKAYNKGKRGAARYVPGTPETRSVPVQTEDAKGRKRTKAVAINGTQARAWAVAQGHEVAERGRLPKSVVQAYAATLV